MSDLVIQHINRLASSEGYTRDTDLGLDSLAPIKSNDLDTADLQVAEAPLPDMMAIDGRSELVQLADHSAITPEEGVDNDRAAAAADIHDALFDLDGTRLTHVQENIDDDNSALNIDPVPFAL